MAKDFTDTLRDTVGQVVRDATQSGGIGKSKGPLAGGRGIAAGAGLAAAAPLAVKGVTKLAKGRLAGAAAKSAVKKPGSVAKDAAKKPGDAVSGITSKLGDSIGKGVGDKVKDKIDESGGAGGIAKEAASGLIPGLGGGGSNGGGGGMEGVGKGRRMPVQQAIDVAVPIETAYNQWTQFEDWTEFMHRVVRVSQDEPTTVNFQAKIWTRTRDFEAEIITQRPDERIKWQVAQGITHTGVVTFHELAPRLTRIEINMDVEPGGMIEKAARGMRHVKRAVRADLHRFKAFIEMQEMETGAWRGVIEDGELVEDHDPSYDEEREYADADALRDEQEEDEDQEEEEPEADADDEEDEEDEEAQAARSKRFERQARASSSGSRRRSSRSSNSGSSGNGRSSGSRSSGSRRSSGNSSSGRRKASAKKS
jgi:uncharacterized membrane protein